MSVPPRKCRRGKIDNTRERKIACNLEESLGGGLVMAKRSKARAGKRAAKKVRKSAAVRKVAKGAGGQTPVKIDSSERPCPKDAVRVGDVPSDRTVEVTITLRGPKLPDIDRPNVASRNLASSFRASKSDADKVSSVLRRYGLSI